MIASSSPSLNRRALNVALIAILFCGCTYYEGVP
jgi:hypothetical protein